MFTAIASIRLDGGVRGRSAVPRETGWSTTRDPSVTLPCFALCFGLLASMHALAETPAPVEQMRQMAHSLRALDYEGSFVFQSGVRVDTLRIVHFAVGDESERLTRLSGPPGEATRHGQSITVQKDGIAPVAFATGAAARLLPLVPTNAVALPNENYRLLMAEPDRVAGYRTNVVDILATDPYRYSYRLWLDEEHKLPLRVALLDGNQRTVEQYMFVTLSIGSLLDDKALDATATITSPDVIVPLGGNARWLVNDLPKGFSLRARQAVSTGKDSEQLVFSDGLASVSAYIELTPEPISDDIALSRGAMNVYIHRDRSWRYTVLGNVPQATVQRIAVSISAVEGHSDPK